jgi:siroheme synthase
LTADLATLPGKVEAAGITSPALIIVGTVVSLRPKLQWFEGETISNDQSDRQ